MMQTTADLHNLHLWVMRLHVLVIADSVMCRLEHHIRHCQPL